MNFISNKSPRVHDGVEQDIRAGEWPIGADHLGRVLGQPSTQGQHDHRAGAPGGIDTNRHRATRSKTMSNCANITSLSALARIVLTQPSSKAGGSRTAHDLGLEAHADSSQSFGPRSNQFSATIAFELFKDMGAHIHQMKTNLAGDDVATVWVDVIWPNRGRPRAAGLSSANLVHQLGHQREAPARILYACASGGPSVGFTCPSRAFDPAAALPRG